MTELGLGIDEEIEVTDTESFSRELAEFVMRGTAPSTIQSMVGARVSARSQNSSRPIADENRIVCHNNLSNLMAPNEAGIESWIADHARELRENGRCIGTNGGRKKRKKRRGRKSTKGQSNVNDKNAYSSQAIKESRERLPAAGIHGVSRLRNTSGDIDEYVFADAMMLSRRNSGENKRSQKWIANEKRLIHYYFHTFSNLEKNQVFDFTCKELIDDIKKKCGIFEEIRNVERSNGSNCYSAVVIFSYICSPLMKDVKSFLREILENETLNKKKKNEEETKGELMFLQSINMETLEAEYDPEDITKMKELVDEFVALLNNEDVAARYEIIGIERADATLKRVLKGKDADNVLYGMIMVTISLSFVLIADRIVNLFKEQVAKEAREEFIRDELKEARTAKAAKMAKMKEKKEKKRRKARDRKVKKKKAKLAENVPKNHNSSKIEKVKDVENKNKKKDEEKSKESSPQPDEKDRKTREEEHHPTPPKDDPVISPPLDGQNTSIGLGSIGRGDLGEPKHLSSILGVEDISPESTASDTASVHSEDIDTADGSVENEEEENESDSIKEIGLLSDNSDDHHSYGDSAISQVFESLFSLRKEYADCDTHLSYLFQ